MVETMQFRDFLFPHNPQRITVEHGDHLVSHFCPGRGDVVQRLGAKAQAVHCQGCFFGDSYRTAVACLQEFREKTADGARGMLLVPGFEPFLAHLKELRFEAQGDGKIIPYTMLFVQAGAV